MTDLYPARVRLEVLGWILGRHATLDGTTVGINHVLRYTNLRQ